MGGHVAGDPAAILAAMTDAWRDRGERSVAASPQGHVMALLGAAREAGALRPVDDSTSDGYHTFGELYRHRAVLTAALFHAWIWSPNAAAACYRTRLHHPQDDEPMFDGMFKVGAELPSGEITYHYPVDCWDLFQGVPVMDYSPKYDGHTAADVADRLDDYLRGKW